MKIKIATAVLALVSVLAIAACDDDSAKPAAPPAVATASQLTVRTAAGPGCLTGTVTTAVVGDDVTANYTAFSVTSGTVTGRKACQLNILASPGPSKRAAVTSADHAGSATLPAGASGLIRTTYYVTAGANLGVTNSALTAPTWNINQPTAPGAVVTPCGQDTALNAKVELAVAGTGGAASAETSAIHFAWQDC